MRRESPRTSDEVHQKTDVFDEQQILTNQLCYRITTVEIALRNPAGLRFTNPPHLCKKESSYSAEGNDSGNEGPPKKRSRGCESHNGKQYGYLR
jgi:hypothetical protein